MGCRHVKIYTWGIKKQKEHIEVDFELDTRGILSETDPYISFKNKVGTNWEVIKLIRSKDKCTEYINLTIDQINNGDRVLGFYCDHGKHRSVALAEILGEYLRCNGYEVDIYHLNI